MNDDFTIQLDKPWDLEYQDNAHLDCDWRITLAETGEDAQTGARIRKIRRYVEKDPSFMIT